MLKDWKIWALPAVCLSALFVQSCDEPIRTNIDIGISDRPSTSCIRNVKKFIQTELNGSKFDVRNCTRNWNDEFRAIVAISSRGRVLEYYVEYRLPLKDKGVILDVIGGPGGNPAVAGFQADSKSQFFRKVSTACGKAIVSPIYKGTSLNSNYPDSSLDDAVEDVKIAISSIKNHNSSIIVGTSLGSLLTSFALDDLTKEFSGSIIFVVPVSIRISDKIDDFNSLPESDLLIAYNNWLDYRINGVPMKIRKHDFNIKFFGDDGRVKLNVPEALRSLPRSSTKKIAVFIAENDDNAGRYDDFYDDYKKIGVDVIKIENSDHYPSVRQWDNAVGSHYFFKKCQN